MTMVSSLRSGPNNYKFCYCLGKGNQGSVFCAQNLKDGDFYAVKALSALPGMSNDLIQKEISIHKRMSHPNIIKYYESIIDGNTLYVVMELGECSLTNFIDSRQDKTLTQQELVKLLKDISAGIAYIHGNNVIHRDIKIDNVIMKHDVYKITDFGVSSVGQFSQTFVGTPVYLAPQVMSNRVFNDLYDKSVDIWALGVLAFQAYFKTNPFFFNGSKLMSQKDFENILDNILTICTPHFDIKRVIVKLKQQHKYAEAEYIINKLKRTSKHVMYLFQKIFDITPESRIKIQSIQQLLNVMQQPELIKKAHSQSGDPNSVYFKDPELEMLSRKPQSMIPRTQSMQNVPSVLNAGYTSLIDQRMRPTFEQQMSNSYSGSFSSTIPMPNIQNTPQMMQSFFGDPRLSQSQNNFQFPQQQTSAMQMSQPLMLKHASSVGSKPVPRLSLPDQIAFLNLTRRLVSQLYIQKIHLVRGVLGALEALICFRREQINESPPLSEYLYPGEIEKYKGMDLLHRRMTIRTMLYNHYKEMFASTANLNQQQLNECMFRLLICSAFGEIVYNLQSFLGHFKIFQGKSTIKDLSQFAPYCTVQNLRAFEAYIVKCFFVT